MPVLLLTCLAGTLTSANADQNVTIGYVGPLTGQIAQTGKDAENGVKLAIDEANAAGITIKGQPTHFALLSEDDAGEPKTAVTVAQKLVDANVNGVVGHITSGATIPASKIYAAAGIPEVSPSATNPEFTRQGFATAFRVIGDDSYVGVVVARYLADEKHYKRVAVIDDRTAYGQGLADIVVKSLKAAGVDVVDREFVSDKTIDFRGILTAIKSKDPQAVVFGGVDTQAGSLRKQMTGLGMTTPLIGAAIETEQFVTLAGAAAAEGTVSAESGQPLAKMANGKTFDEKFRKRFGPVLIYAPYAYDAAWALINAMKLANSTVPADYLPFMKKISFDGVTGPIAFDSKGDLRAVAVSLYRVQDGKFQSFSTLTVK
ncbi:branched-chain amino acid ABC transporter substrate-binding protein [Paraburkholderia xenovorans]|uniref:branched-chain amino acid ABC transporter substrate-binding protein n=1 Tax=Paraburkholderia xenovorans TaxID=36873 RepID=UPI0038BC5485